MRLKTIVSFLTFLVVLTCNISLVSADMFYYDVFGHWAEDIIYWATNEVNIFNGYGNGTFKPDDNIKRSEYITILYRAAKEQGVIQPISLSTNLYNNAEGNEEDSRQKDKEGLFGYIDLNNKFWAYNEIKVIGEYINNSNKDIKFEDIFPGDKFEPDKYITREEAILLSSFFVPPSIEKKGINFTDIANNYKYLDELKKLVDNEIIIGYPNNTFRPYKNITRAESVSIIKKIYEEMEFLKGNYLNDIQLISIADLEEKFPLFGDYSKSDLNKDDYNYMLAVDTLEYKSIGGYIFPGEEHMYDSEPLQTLWELKNSGYYNKTGVNYYLIKFDNLTEEERKQLFLELFDDYMMRDDITDYESLLIFNESFNFDIEEEKLLKGLDKWHSLTENYIMQRNIEFLKYKVYIKNDDQEALSKIIVVGAESTSNNNEDNTRELTHDELQIKKAEILNKAYIMFYMKKFEDAEKILREGWEELKRNKLYESLKDEYNKEFVGSIKQVLINMEN